MSYKYRNNHLASINLQQWPCCDQLIQLPRRLLSVHIKIVDWGFARSSSTASTSGLGAGAAKADSAKILATRRPFILSTWDDESNEMRCEEKKSELVSG